MGQQKIVRQGRVEPIPIRYQPGGIDIVEKSSRQRDESSLLRLVGLGKRQTTYRASFTLYLNEEVDPSHIRRIKVRGIGRASVDNDEWFENFRHIWGTGPDDIEWGGVPGNYTLVLKTTNPDWQDKRFRVTIILKKGEDRFFGSSVGQFPL